MADNRNPSQADQFSLQFKRLAAQIRCSMPGNIGSFDPASQRASVTPGIQLKVNVDKTPEYVTLPEIQNVPVVMPYAQGAGYLLTLPIKSGDPCLLVFSDRSIDNYLQKGSVSTPEGSGSEDTTTPRSHHLTDAICIPGLFTDPATVPEYSAENIEIRDVDRKTYISLGPEGIAMTDGQAVWTMSGGAVTMDCPTGITYSTQGNMNITSQNMDLADSNRIKGGLKSESGTFTDKDGVNLNTHAHTGVQPGNGNSSEPVK